MLCHKESYQPAFGYVADTPPKRLLENLVNRSGGLALPLLIILPKRKKARPQRFRIARKKARPQSAFKLSPIAKLEQLFCLIFHFGACRLMPTRAYCVDCQILQQPLSTYVSDWLIDSRETSAKRHRVFQRREDTRFAGCNSFHPCTVHSSVF